MATNKVSTTGHTTNHEKLINFLDKYLKKIMISFIVIILAVIAVVGGVFFREYKVSEELKAYLNLAGEFDTQLMNISKKYQPAAGQENDETAIDKDALEKDKTAAVKDYAAKLEVLTEKSHWGYVSHNGYYIAGGLYFSVKDYQKSLDLYLKAAKKVDNDVFKILALQQAAVCYEWLNKNDEAMKIYQDLEKKFPKSDSLDRIYYDLGRMYQLKGDKVKAEEYFTNVIKNHSSSVFAKKSQERVMLLGSK
ncbi:MAG: tetratricopeptide repeat protein [Spirochaetes bacterium]|nr:tetratricopeptide repeat protein [Spirochaetota bacterium]